MGKDLYDTTTPTTPATPPDREAVANVYGQTEAARLFRNDTIAKTLYGDTPAKPAWPGWYPVESNIGADIDRNLARLAPRLRLSAEDQVRERASYFAMLKRLGLDQDAQFGVLLHDKLTTARLAEQRPGAEDPAARDTELRRTSEETYSRLRQRWGGEFDQLLGRVTRYVAADPEFEALLGVGPGADFDVLNPLFEHIQRHNLGR